jgi:hypothetical protein
MKIRRVLAHAKKRAFIVQAGKGTYEVPYAKLTVKLLSVLGVELTWRASAA